MNTIVQPWSSSMSSNMSGKRPQRHFFVCVPGGLIQTRHEHYDTFTKGLAFVKSGRRDREHTVRNSSATTVQQYHNGDNSCPDSILLLRYETQQMYRMHQELEYRSEDFYAISNRFFYLQVLTSLLNPPNLAYLGVQRVQEMLNDVEQISIHRFKQVGVELGRFLFQMTVAQAQADHEMEDHLLAGGSASTRQTERQRQTDRTKINLEGAPADEDEFDHTDSHSSPSPGGHRGGLLEAGEEINGGRSANNNGRSTKNAALALVTTSSRSKKFSLISYSFGCKVVLTALLELHMLMKQHNDRIEQEGEVEDENLFGRDLPDCARSSSSARGAAQQGRRPRPPPKLTSVIENVVFMGAHVRLLDVFFLHLDSAKKTSSTSAGAAGSSAAGGRRGGGSTTSRSSTVASRKTTAPTSGSSSSASAPPAVSSLGRSTGARQVLVDEHDAASLQEGAPVKTRTTTSGLQDENQEQKPNRGRLGASAPRHAAARAIELGADIEEEVIQDLQHESQNFQKKAALQKWYEVKRHLITGRFLNFYSLRDQLLYDSEAVAGNFFIGREGLYKVPGVENFDITSRLPRHSCYHTFLCRELLEEMDL
ncbi:unnamed protein product [Amoebophrya sp. A120]|nr:unnamed protein product [Amoebophrya sp. A120]|eukprot:GSA120T00016430001.1